MDASQSLSLPSEGTLFLVNRFFDCIGGGGPKSLCSLGEGREREKEKGKEGGEKEEGVKGEGEERTKEERRNDQD